MIVFIYLFGKMCFFLFHGFFFYSLSNLYSIYFWYLYYVFHSTYFGFVFLFWLVKEESVNLVPVNESHLLGVPKFRIVKSSQKIHHSNIICLSLFMVIFLVLSSTLYSSSYPSFLLMFALYIIFHLLTYHLLGLYFKVSFL